MNRCSLDRRAVSFRSSLVALAVLCFVSACSKKSDKPADDPGKPKTVSRALTIESESLASEAAFAIQLKDYARAAEALTKAVKLRDDVPEWWMDLGVCLKRSGKAGDVKGSYKKALALHETRYEKTKNSSHLMPQLYLLLLLDREKDARALLERSMKNHPTDTLMKQFVDTKGLDKLMQDPYIRENKI